MSTVRKTITLTDDQNDWIKSKIDAGEYTNDSEFIRDLIRRDQRYQEKELAKLREALIQGELSGEPKSFDLISFKKRMSKNYG